MQHVWICDEQLDTATQTGAVSLRGVTIVHLRLGRHTWEIEKRVEAYHKQAGLAGTRFARVISR